MHIGRSSCHFPQVFVRKTYVTLGFPRGKPKFSRIFDGFRTVFLRFSLGKRTLPWVLLRKNYFLYILDGLRAISLRFREENHATLVVVAVVVAVGAVAVILIVLVNAIVLVNIIVIAGLVVAVAMTIVIINILIIVVLLLWLLWSLWLLWLFLLLLSLLSLWLCYCPVNVLVTVLAVLYFNGIGYSLKNRIQ